jgi:transcriptional regulator of acetoin/glycerol metabolism
MMNNDLKGLSVKEYDRSVRETWEKLMTASPVGDGPVRNVVMESWIRSRDRGVDPSLKAAPIGASGDRLEYLRETNRDICEAASDCVAPLAPLFSDLRAALVTTDPHGTVLTAHGDPRAMDMLSTVHLLPGGCWDESGAGTNAIGTALSLNAQTQIHAQEHFCQANKVWTCAASPVRDPIDGSILGVIDLTAAGDNFNAYAWPFVTTLVERAQAHLLQRELLRRNQLLDAFCEEVERGDAIAVFDRLGRLVKEAAGLMPALRQRGIEIGLDRNVRRLRVSAEDVVHGRFAELPEGLRPEWLSPLRLSEHNIGFFLRVPRHSPAAAAGPQKRTALPLAPAFLQIAASSPSLGSVLQQAQRFATQSAPILIESESGTGKDVLAHAIHAAGPRSGGPFVAINCAALPREILGAELFGHAEGAFTGARRGGAKGKFEQASGGTIFLDEIGDMPLELQPYLLRVLEEKVVWRLGDSAPKKIDVRVICATNRSLPKAIEGGHFRVDLYHRINVARLTIPPLRDRRSDIPALVHHFLGKNVLDEEDSIRVSPEVMERFMSYSWPGNVRELRNVLERMTLLASSRVLELEDLPAELHARGPNVTILTESEPNTLSHNERRMILEALCRENGNVRQAARHLGISRPTLYRRLGAYGIKAKECRAESNQTLHS